MEKNGNNGEDFEDAENPTTYVIGELSRPATLASLPELLEFAASIERKDGFGDERARGPLRPGAAGDVAFEARATRVRARRDKSREKMGKLARMVRSDEDKEGFCPA